jgi:hypothetical protein
MVLVVVVVIAGAGLFWFYESNRTQFHYEAAYPAGDTRKVILATDRRISLANETVFQNFTATDTSITSEYHNPSVYVDVYDPDGIEAVWFSYRRANESTAQTKPMEKRPQGNRYHGIFSITVSEPETDFVIRIYANDSLGNTASSREYNLRVQYYPYHYHDPGIVLGPAQFILLVVVALSAVVVVILYLVFKRARGQQSSLVEDDLLSSRGSQRPGCRGKHPMSLHDKSQPPLRRWS